MSFNPPKGEIHSHTDGIEYEGDRNFHFGGVKKGNGREAPGEEQTTGIKNPFITSADQESATAEVLKEKIPSLLGMLPVLLSFPMALLAYFLTTEKDESIGYRFTSIATSGFFSSMFLLLVKGIMYFNVIPTTSKSTTKDIKNTFLLFAGVSLVFLATTFLSVNRISVLYIGLFLNKLNTYTPAAFLLDLFWGVDNWSSILFGYSVVLGSYQILSKKLEFSSASNCLGSLRPDILFGLLLFSSANLIFFGHNISVTMIGVNLLASVVLLVSLPESDLRVPIVTTLLVSVFSLTMEYLSTSFTFDFRTVADLLLPITISVRKQISIQSEQPNSPDSSTSILKELLSHSDTRAIFNFLLLNTTFMFVQLLYSFRSKSLGLLSDSLHMALDCTSLALGLVAGILSKNKIDPNGKFPFGLRNFEILAGFTNGTLLIGISGSIIFEAVGRLWNPIVLQKTNELIVVSILGLLVNLVGIFAFNHGHGHDHGHSHSHGHGHSHGHSDEHSQLQSHSHSHSHSNSQSEDKQEECNEEKVNPEMNDNMRGIFLHILADTLGSVGVVISTILTKIFRWDGFDPIASIIIAVLIFLSAVPLIKSTASTLLLKLTSEKEIKIRSILKDITQIKGVKSFTTPRFWPNSTNSLNGYVHIQVYIGENTSFIKRQCEKVFQLENIEVMIQIENDYDDCWCRSLDIPIPIQNN